MADFRVSGELTMDGSRFAAGLRTAESAASGFARGLSSRLAAVFSVGAITMFARRTMEFADQMEETASRIGVGVEKLQEWTFAARQTGADVETLTRVIEALTAAAMDADKIKLFERMGIKPTGMTPEGLFGAVAGWARGRSSTDVRSGLTGIIEVRRLGPIINMLTSDLDSLGESARKSGAIMDEKTVTALARLNDQLASMGQILMTQFAPAILTTSKALLRFVGSIPSALKWWVTATSRLSPAEIAGSFGSIGFLWNMLFRRGALREGGEQAKAEFDDEMTKLEEQIARLMLVAPPPPATIGEPVAGTTRAGAKSAMYSDALVAVGNFLGSNNRAITTATNQLQVQQKILGTLEKQLGVMQKNSMSSDTYPL